MAKTKDQIAMNLYSDNFEYLSSGEKAAVTKAFNAQKQTRQVKSTVSGGVKATIGRVGVNGVKTCILNKGATIADLLSQSGYGFDSDKERILDNDTGNVLDLTDKVKNNGTYAIAVEVRSA